MRRKAILRRHSSRVRVLLEGRVAAPVSALLAVVDEFGVTFSLTSALELLFVPIPAFDAEQTFKLSRRVDVFGDAPERTPI